MAKLDLDTCMDIFDWFDDATFEHINHLLISKVNGEQRVRSAMPAIRQHARWLVNLHRDTDSAYPEETLPKSA